MATANPTISAENERHASRGSALHQRGAEPGQRAELRTHRHRAHDQDRVVQHHSAGRDHRGEGEEREIGDGERRLLVGRADELLPDHRVRALARSFFLGVVGARGQGQVDVVDGDRATGVDSEVPQARDQLVARLPRHIAQHQIALGVAGGARHHHQMGGADRLLDETEHLGRAVGGGEQTQVQHAVGLLGMGAGSELAQ